MIKRWLLLLSAAVIGMSMMIAPAQAAPDGAPPPAPLSAAAGAGQARVASNPAGCETWAEWVGGGSTLYFGRGNARCQSGRYDVKNVCRSMQSGGAYVTYGGSPRYAPGVATVVCGSGHQAESVHVVADVATNETTGCVTWGEWVSGGGSMYWGRGAVQCDTGRYQAKNVCRNMQSDAAYVTYGGGWSNPRQTNIASCGSGHRAESVHAVPELTAPGINGCVFWREMVSEGGHLYYGRGAVQCDTGRYRAVNSCHNVVTGARYTTGGYISNAPAASYALCNRGDRAERVDFSPA
ncbi:hypothetical protein [Streptomyces sp. NPDC020965]|uniref:hypothetical protein n=1 Tax=Streptomyces sp. NPDC020965 TaxID=3365105 RepID=UPI00379E7050